MGDFDFDGIFDQVVDGLVGAQISDTLKEYDINKNRPSITSLNFVPLPAGKAEEIRNIKTGLFGGGTKKKLAASIEEGRTTYAEVLVLARERRIVERSENDPKFNTYWYFYKIADLSGVTMREDVAAIDDDHVISFDYYDGNSASDTGCADKVNPEIYMHMYLLHYYLKDDQYYVLLTKEQMDDLSLLVHHAGNRWHFVEDGVGYKW